MDNKPEATFLDTLYIPDSGNAFKTKATRQLHHCLVASCTKNCRECLFSEDHKKEFDIWVALQRIAS